MAEKRVEIEVPYKGWLRVSVLVPDESDAFAAGTEWWKSTIVPELAAIASRPEFVRVRALQKRRAQAVQKRNENAERIEALKGECQDKALDAKAMDKAAQEIERCTAAIRRAELEISTLDEVLPASLESRRGMSAQAMDVLRSRIIEPLEAECASCDEAIRGALPKPVAARLVAAEKFRLALALFRYDDDRIAGYAPEDAGAAVVGA